MKGTALALFAAACLAPLAAGCSGNVFARNLPPGSAANDGGVDASDAARDRQEPAPPTIPGPDTAFGPEEQPTGALVKEFASAWILEGGIHRTSHHLPGDLRLEYGVRNSEFSVSAGPFLGFGNPALPLQPHSAWPHNSFGISWIDLRYNLFDSSFSSPLVGLAIGTDLYPQKLLRFSGVIGLELPFYTDLPGWRVAPTIGFTTFYGGGRANSTFDFGLRLTMGASPPGSSDERQRAERILLSAAANDSIVGAKQFTPAAPPIVDYLQANDENFHHVTVQYPNCYLFVGHGTQEVNDPTADAPGWPGSVAFSLRDANGKFISGELEQASANAPTPDKTIKHAPALGYYCPPESPAPTTVTLAIQNKGRQSEWIGVSVLRRRFDSAGTSDRFVAYRSDVARRFRERFSLGAASATQPPVKSVPFGSMALWSGKVEAGKCVSAVAVARPDSDLDALLFIDRGVAFAAEAPAAGKVPVWELADSDTKYYTDTLTRLCNGGPSGTDALTWHLLVLVIAPPNGARDPKTTSIPLGIETFEKAIGQRDLLALPNRPLALPTVPAPAPDGGVPRDYMIWAVPRFARDLDNSLWLPLTVDNKLPDARFSLLVPPSTGSVTFDLEQNPKDPKSTDKEVTVATGVADLEQDLLAQYTYELRVKTSGLGRQDAFMMTAPTVDQLTSAGAIIDLGSKSK